MHLHPQLPLAEPARAVPCHHGDADPAALLAGAWPRPPGDYTAHSPLQEIGRFAYIVSHDLRAPLINVRGFAKELRDASTVLTEALRAIVPHLEGRQAAVVTHWNQWTRHNWSRTRSARWHTS